MQVWEIGDLVDLVVCRLHCEDHYHHDRHLDNAIVFMIFIVIISIWQWWPAGWSRRAEWTTSYPGTSACAYFVKRIKKNALWSWYVLFGSLTWVRMRQDLWTLHDVFNILIIVKVNVIFCAYCYILIVIVTCLMRFPGVWDCGGGRRHRLAAIVKRDRCLRGSVCGWVNIYEIGKRMGVSDVVDLRARACDYSCCLSVTQQISVLPNWKMNANL